MSNTHGEWLDKIRGRNKKERKTVRLIDANALWMDIIHSDDILEIIERMPTIEPERKKGKWVKMSDGDGIYWACSECGEDIPRVSHFDPQFDLFPRLESIDKTNFCPNCGADMRGEHQQNFLSCESCQHRDKDWHEEPCDSCTFGARENHFEPWEGEDHETD